ncbi:MAG: hypothetical protein C4322_21170 [Mastigocladus sp. ERB_26_1]
MGFALRSTTSFFCFFAIGIAFYRYIKHLPKAREVKNKARENQHMKEILSVSITEYPFTLTLIRDLILIIF